MSEQPDAKRMLDSRGLYEGPTIHSMNPLLLMEKIIRERILESLYWKEQAFGLNAATLCDRAVNVSYIGGQYSNQKPTPFICLVFKLLQLQPEREIILAYLRNEDFKYLRAIAAFYIRLTWDDADVYKTLEPFLADYRKLRLRTQAGFHLTYMDEYIDNLLTKERVCDVALPRIPTRTQLEDVDKLDPREPLVSDAEIEDEGDEGDGGGED